jgi:sRNA-binding regulator protein Hfq
MKQNLKRISIVSLILALLFALAGVLLIKHYNTDADTNKALIEKKQGPAVNNIIKKSETPVRTQNETQLQTKFNSNEEIKKVYGRLESVFLFDGREYTGVVLSVDNYYTMVTVDGVKKLPMKDVKMRLLIE